MTTLPTTTPMRLPRPAGGMPLAIPGAMSGQSAGSSFQMSGADIWRVVRSNMWLILGMLLVSGVGGFFLNKYLARYHSSFTATGYTQLSPPVSFSLIKDQPVSIDIGTLGLEQRTQAALLKQDSLYIEVLQNKDAEIRKTEWFQSFHGDVFEAKEDLVDYFRVEIIPESKLIAVKMSYSVPRDCKTIVEDIVNAHLENQKKIVNNRQLARSVQLNNLKNRYQFRKDDLGRELRDRSVRLSIDGMGTPGRLSAKEVELQDLLKAQFELNHNASFAADSYDRAIAQINEGADLSAVQEMISKDPDVISLKQQLSYKEMQVSEMSQLGRKHRSLLMLMASRDELIGRVDDAISAARAKGTAIYMEALRQQRDGTKLQADTMKEKVDSAKQDLGDLTNQMNQYLTLRDEEETIRDMLKEVNDQLDQISQLGANADMSAISWARLPDTPDMPSFPKLPWTMAICVTAGLALALGIAFTRELLDTSIRSPRDITRVGQLNLLGIIPHEDEDPQSQGAPLPMVIFQAPHSMLAEQFRQVRSRLQHATSLDTTRSIMVTSPSPGDGKSTVACNLAAGLALNGRRILLVDSNFRRPELHKIYGLPNDMGFSAVLQEPETFAQAVCQTQVPNLDVLPSGQRPTNATELIESQLLIDFIERAMEEYDHVIFDSGPFVFASESVALAPRVDGVVIVVRAQSSSRGLLQRMRDDLRKSKAEHLGVVLNAVRAQAGGYYNRNIKTYYAYQNGPEA